MEQQAPPPIIIDSNPDSFRVYCQKIWHFRSLVWVFAKRDLKIKFAQTGLGLAWVVIQPLVAILVYTAFFSFVVKIPSGNIPYILFVISGINLWSLFSYIFSQGVSVLLANQEIIRKMAFPKILLPFSKVLVGGIEFLVSFSILFIAWLLLSRNLVWPILLIFLPIIGIVLFSLSLTLTLLAFSVKRRDLMHIGPFIVYFGIWFTPVFYPVSLVPAEFQHFIYLNPIAGMIDFFRWTIGINTTFSLFYFADFAVILALFFGAVFLFKNIEDSIVDTI